MTAVTAVRIGTTRPAARLVGTVLGALSVVLLVVTVWLGALVLAQSHTLQSSVDYTQDVVDANERTLGQVQRELLRLKLVLADPTTDPAALELQIAFVDQRVQEGALPHQGDTLASQALMDRSRELAAQWTGQVRPELTRALADRNAAGVSAAGRSVTDLERSYNQLVSDGENSRKIRAGQANAETRRLLEQARTLLVVLAVTVSSFLLFLALTGLAFWQFHRHRERAAAELLAVNAELRTHSLVVHATSNLVIVTDALGRIEWVNPAFVRTTGHALCDVRGRSPGELLQGAGTDPAAAAEMAAAQAAGRGFVTEVLNYTAAGEPYWVHVEAHPVRDEHGRLTQFVAIETDVTERRRTEENLRRATETAMSMAEEKAGFLATMSHEIRTPLNAVLGTTALLAGTHLDAEQAEYVDTAQRSGTLLLALVDDILDYSALESGRIAVEAAPFDVRALLSEITSVFAGAAAAKAVELAAEVAPEVPVRVCGDQARVRQVLVNLVGNGLKFTHRGEVRVDVDVDADPDAGTGTRLRITVRDTGIGMSEHQIERIFLPFTQANASTTRTYGGSGLGLSICRRIADHLGGTLEVESTLGLGSVFTFTVPVGPAEPDKPSATQEVTGGPDRSALRVLLAEDDVVNQMVAVRMLGRLGVRAEVVADGQQAVDAVRATGYDLVLMDVHMPRMDGVEATRGIRKLGLPSTPLVVALTANALEGDRERLLAAGMDGYLSKPVTLAALAELLDRVALGEMDPTSHAGAARA